MEVDFFFSNTHIIVLKREKGSAPYEHHHLTQGRAMRGCLHSIEGTKPLDN